MVAVLRQCLTERVIDNAENRVEILARAVAAGPLPTDLPISDDDEEVVQVFDAAGPYWPRARTPAACARWCGRATP